MRLFTVSPFKLRSSYSILLVLAIALGLAGIGPRAAAQTTVQIHDVMVAGTNPMVGTAAAATLPYSPYRALSSG